MTLTLEQLQALNRILSTARADLAAAVNRNQSTGLFTAYTLLLDAIAILASTHTERHLHFADRLAVIRAKILLVTDLKQPPSHLTNCLHVIDDITIILPLADQKCVACGTQYVDALGSLGVICRPCSLNQ